MNRRKLAKMEVMQQGDVQVHPIGWPWIGHVAMELTGEDGELWIERPGESDAVDRLVEVVNKLIATQHSDTGCDGDSLTVVDDDIMVQVEFALAAVEKEGKHE
jgi:hypothetical protein